ASGEVVGERWRLDAGDVETRGCAGRPRDDGLHIQLAQACRLVLPPRLTRRIDRRRVPEHYATVRRGCRPSRLRVSGVPECHVCAVLRSSLLTLTIDHDLRVGELQAAVEEMPAWVVDD